MRAIDGDALRKKLLEELHKRSMQGFGKGLMIANSCVVNAPTIEPEPHWIPCSERLPFAEYGEGDNVLATCGHRDGENTSIRWIRTLYFNGGCWCYPTGETYDQKVLAWMPLPEPWRGEEHGQSRE